MISYTDSADGVTPHQLRGFFGGWANPPSPETHLELISRSHRVVLARTSGSRVVGYVTSISDAVLTAHIPLLEVLPRFRRRGIGTELMRMMLARLEGFYAIDVVCDADLQPFYRRLGFSESNAMIVRQQ